MSARMQAQSLYDSFLNVMTMEEKPFRGAATSLACISSVFSWINQIQQANTLQIGFSWKAA
jgi:hypothetical protein